MSELEFSLAPEDLLRVTRLPFLQRDGRATPAQMFWHDTPDGTLASRKQSLSEQRGHWRLERLAPCPETPWPPSSPAPLLGEGADPHAVGHAPTPALAPIAALTGRRRVFRVALPEADPSAGGVPPLEADPSAGVQVTIIEGELRGVAAQQAVCRIVLKGPAPALREVATELARAARVSVPRAGLAAQAIAVARGQALAPRHLGAPVILPGQPLTDSIALIVGQLVDVVLHWSAPAAMGATPAPVHQMRVATRRLRSALSIFRHVTACPEVTPLSPALKDLAARLGAARDWDVFLDGAGERILAAFPGERRVTALLAAARRRRSVAYAELRAYLGGGAFRELEVALGCTASLRPWEAAAGLQNALQDALHQDTAVFATAVLTRRLRQVRHAGRGMETLSIAALHELRKDCKRLRYAAEFFQPLFPDKAGRRFLKHLAALQEELGSLNDGAVAASLMAHLGRAERSYAAGLVGGFVAAGAAPTRDSIARTWKLFRRQDPFWVA